MRFSFFGCTWERCVSAKNHAYGKEQDKGFGRYNFDGRMYDERSCRWMSLDPQAGKYASFSPYSYTGGSPIAHIEVDGGYFIGVDKRPVIVGKDQDGKWVLSDNASDDLRKMVGLINNSKSPLAMRIFGIVANNNTKITFKFVEGKVKDKLLGLHQVHDKSGKPLEWDKINEKFIGEPEFIKPTPEEAKKHNSTFSRLEYKEATISIFTDNFYYKNMDYHGVEETMVAIFSHEAFHNIEQLQLKKFKLSGQGDGVEDNTLTIEDAVVGEQIFNKNLKFYEIKEPDVFKLVHKISSKMTQLKDDIKNSKKIINENEK